jgi:hypothetical protein
MSAEILPFPKINYTDLDAVMECLTEAYEAEEIQGMMIVVKNKDRSFVATSAGDMNYLEMLGMLEHLKFEILMDSEPE